MRGWEKSARVALRRAGSNEAISQVFSDKSMDYFAPPAMTQPEKTSHAPSPTSAVGTLEQEQEVTIEAEHRTHRVDLGPVDFIPVGEGRAYVVNDLTIAVFRQRDGRLFATNNHCPHRQGPLADGIFGAGKVICPLHAWKFDLEVGRCVAENVTIPLYPAQVVNGHIVVEIGPLSSDPSQREQVADKGENVLLAGMEK